MKFSPPALHAPVLRTQAHKDFVSERLSAMASQRLQAKAAAPRAGAAPDASMSIPLLNVSLEQNFDAYVTINFAGGNNDSALSLMVDTGNSALIVPDFDALAALPDFDKHYTFETGAKEPWCCEANVVTGPITFPIDADTSYTIPKCKFYACTKPNKKGDRTANFGAGCVTPWRVGNNDAIQSPLSYSSDYGVAEFDYVPLAENIADGATPNVAEGSWLTLYRTVPPHYCMFGIVKDLPWMSLRPKSLSIGNTVTEWPGVLKKKPIAMIDTGGGPVFLSDTNDKVWGCDWPGTTAVPLPDWTPGSVCCQSIDGDLTVVLEDDAGNPYSYRIETARLPAPARGLTLVMCRTCNKMQDEEGMNIGGLSALFNYIVIDYAAAKVGFKAKPAKLV